MKATARMLARIRGARWLYWRDRPATYEIAGAIHDWLIALGIARPTR